MLTGIAKVMVTIDPARARRLLDDAERLAPAHESGRTLALVDIAEVLAVIDPDRAERIARTITEPRLQGVVLREIARTVVGTDPDRAEQVACTITTEYDRALALIDVAGASSKDLPGGL